MQSEALAKKAADAVGVTPYCDMRPFVEQAVKWALNEAALSTNAEPVKTAPAVAVKALQYAYSAGFAASSQGYNGEIFPDFESDNEWLGTRNGELSEIHSALSAQVQDAAEDPDALFWRVRIAYLRGAEWRDQTGSMELAEKASYDYADKITSPMSTSPASKHGDAE